MRVWLENGEPSIAFGSAWHTHPKTMVDLWAMVDSVQDDVLVIAMDVGGDTDEFETTLNLSQSDALAQHLSSPYSAPRTRIKSFGGTADQELP